MIITTIPEFCIQYDEPADLLRVAWTAGRDMRRFQHAFTQLRGVIKQQAVYRVVLELNAMPDIPVYDQMWLSTSFMPALLKLALQQVVVVLSARRVYNQHVVESVLAAVETDIPFDVQFFAHAETALAWLTDDSPRLTDLLLEWADYHPSPGHPSDEVAEPLAPYGRPEPAGCQPDS